MRNFITPSVIICFILSMFFSGNNLYGQGKMGKSVMDLGTLNGSAFLPNPVRNAPALPQSALSHPRGHHISDNNTVSRNAPGNYRTFHAPLKKTSPEAMAANAGYEDHPEAGMLFPGAPCSNCYELIGKRTEISKTFLQEGTSGSDGGKDIMVQTGSLPMHYKDAQGNWRTIKSALVPSNSQKGVYTAMEQEVPVTINTNKADNFSSLGKKGEIFQFNHNLELIYAMPNGSEVSLGAANFTNHTGGDDGVYITNAWPGIDIEMHVVRGAVKTNFYINHAMPEYADGKLQIRDHLQMDAGLSLYSDGKTTLADNLFIKNASGQDVYVISAANVCEKNNMKNTMQSLDYAINGNILNIVLPGNFLDRAASSYPVIIDPLVSTATVTTPVKGSSYSAALAAMSGCPYYNAATTPANTTITDIRYAFIYVTNSGAWLSDGAMDFYITGGCRSPIPPTGFGGLYWTCNLPPYGPGTCTADGSAAYTMVSDFAACMPAPACAPHDLGITMYFYEIYNTKAQCGNKYITSGSDLTITVYGHTVEFVSAIPTPASICQGSSSSLAGVGQYGVPPYTFSWSPGAVAGTPATVTPAATTVYTLTITDVCGITATGNTTVNVTPIGPISGTFSLCVGGTSTLTDLSGSGNTWTSSNPGVATITSPGGVVTAVAAGTTTITVSNTTTGCTATHVVTVNGLPNAGTISGTPTVCTGANTALTDAATGGAWSSVNPSTGTVGTSGVVSGIATGTTTISYTVTNSCGTAAATQVVTVNPTPNAGTIAGTPIVCAGSNTILTDATTGGIWSSVTLSVGTVDGSGNVTGVSAGNTTISYTVANSCGTAAATQVVTVNPLPGASTISGTLTVCVGANTALTDASTGGLWTSSNPSTGTVSTSGVVSGISTGTTTISYTVTNSCGTAVATQVVTVNPLPNAGTITGTPIVCAGANTALTDAAAGGAWSSVTSSVGTVDGSGNVTGVSAGNTIISYTVANSCGTAAATQVVTVNPIPNAGTITGTPIVCAGSNTALTDAATGGIWSSVTLSVGTVDGSGNVTGVSAGNTTISYTVTNSCGTAAATQVVTVNPIPNAGTITGTPIVCAGSNTALTDAATGGVWSSVTLSVGAVDGSGNVTGVSAGNTTISYTVTNSCGTAAATQVITVNPLPNAGAITGTEIVCPTSTSLLSDGISGGTWSSSATGIATISTSGLVAGVSLGTTTISYVVTNSCGTAAATAIVTVNASVDPGSISGTQTVCVSSTTTLSDGVSGGVWSSGSTAVATVGTDGVVSGVSVGTATISYFVTNSCGSASATAVVTVNALPVAGTITGTRVVCAGSITALTDAAAGGAWSSVTSSVGTVDASGNVTGIASGNTTISYTVTNSCGTAAATQMVTVNPLPNAGAITGTPIVCAGSSNVLTDVAAGGAWSSVTSSVGTVDASGNVAGIAAGNTTISYTVTNSCGTVAASQVVTVNALPNAGTITGNAVVCAGATTALTDAASGGAWSSVTSSVGTVDASGNVAGIASGNTTVSYTVTNSCGIAAATQVVTVNPLPNAGTITGTPVVCAGAHTALTDATAGGAWSSVTSSVGTVDASGNVAGMAAGNTTISYTVTNSCGTVAATQVVTVNALPSAGAITGTAVVCAGAITALTDAASGGAWSSVTSSVGTVDASGNVAGIASGNTTISYTVINSCGTAAATQVVTVNPLPNAGTITGTPVVCAGAHTSLTDATAGGIWSSVTSSVGTVDASGNVAGIAAGNTTISYTVTNSCGTVAATQVVTVNALPNAGTIAGTAVVCAGANTILTDGTSGGAWSSVTSSVGTVDAFGNVTGISAGNTTISYTVTNSCGTAAATRIVTVNALPNAGTITGTPVVCAGANTNLTDATSGGTWSSATPAIGTVNASGVVAGISSGTTTISYTITNTCGATAATQVVTVNPLPNAGTITGTLTVCVGATTALTDASAGGVWSSANPGKGTVDASGVVTGIAAGTAKISYTVTNSCGTATTTKIVTVNPLPNATAVLGTLTVCVGATTALSDAAAGGVWSSVSPARGTVDAFGVVTGISAGTTRISYTITNGCGTDAASKVVTVNPLPNPGTITGTAIVCAGSNTALTDATTGGTWSSVTPSVGTVSATGVVSGILAGTTTISYTATNSCGTAAAIRVVTVNTLPNAGTITGTPVVCAGANTALTNAAAGGAWSSVTSSVGTVDAAGNVSGISSGNTTISYTVTNSCGTAAATQVVTVNALPNAGTITGTPIVCAGANTALTDAAAGGAWSSVTSSVGTVDASGNVAGISVGNTTISYTVTNSCGTAAATQVVTVNALPNAGTITGTPVVCAGANTALTDAAAGGAWSSVTSSVGTVDAAGNVTGISVGNTTISYTVTNSCGTAAATQVVTVNSVSSAGTISGIAFVCVGANTALTDATPGGAWSSVAPSICTVDPTGAVTGISSGTTTISYTVNNICGASAATQVVTVNPVPGAGTISGTAVVCVGLTTALTDAAPGGIWTSGSPSVATVDGAGLVSGIATGVAGITYTVTSGAGCTNFAAIAVTVNPLSSAITGVTIICTGGTTTLSNAASGGTWSSSNVNASIDPLSGTVTGNNAGTATITYALSTGCFTTTIVTVTPAPTAAPTNDGPICAGGTVNLSAHGAGGTSVYVWNGSGLSSSAIPNPSATPVTTGIYSLIVTDGTTNSGCSASYTTTVTVNTISILASNDGPACAGGSVNLTATPSGSATPAGYSWNGPAGYNAGIQNPAIGGITAGSAGIYTVTVNGIGAGCIAIATTNVLINTIGITASNDGPACAGGTIHLTSAPSGSATPSGYAWSGPSGYSAGIQNPTLGSVTTAMGGTYVVSVSATGSGCSATATVNVVVNTFGVVAASNSPVCVNGTVNLTATPTGIAPASYNWSGPLSFTSTNQNPTLSGVATNRAGIYTLSISAPGSGCSATTTTNVVVNTIGISASNDAPACAGGNVNFTATPSGSATPVSYTWNGPASYNASTQNPMITAITTSGAGTYTVTVNGGGSACIAIATTNVVVRTIGITGSNDGPACVGGIVHLTSAPSGSATPAGYSWSGPSSYVSTSQNPTLSSVNTGMTGTYAVTVSAPGSGCSATATVNVLVSVFNVVASNNGPICIGGTLDLLATPSGTITPASYNWSGPTFVPAIQNPTFEGETSIGSGTYTVVIAASGSGCTAMATTNVLVGTIGLTTTNDGPVCTGTPLHLTSTPSGSVPPTSYSWRGPAGYTSTILSPTISGTTTAQSGIYTITGTAPGSGCIVVTTTNATVVAPPSSIFGPTAICVGASLSVSDLSSGGTWTSSNPAAATIGSTSGILTGLAPGITSITYTLVLGCSASTVITVNPTPVVTGAMPICLNSSVTLNADLPGGIWTSQNLSHAAVDSFTGVVSGTIDLGTSIIFYTLPTGCQGSQTVTVNVIPSGIAGPHAACLGGTTTLNDVYGGGFWSSTNTTVGTVGTTGGEFVTVTGIGIGTTTISYTISNGCAAIYNVTVSPIAAVIGSAPLCIASSIALSDPAGGGTWSSAHATIATVGSSSGIITGVGTGTTTVVYTTAAGCTASTIVTVLPTPTAITGPATVCVGSSSTLSETATGGAWSSSNGDVSFGSYGYITGLSSGTVNISYTLPDGCAAIIVVTVNDLPSIPTGTVVICAGSTSALTDLTSGGAWSSSTPAVATVGISSGIVTGVAAGTTTITYSTGTTGCSATVTVTVNTIYPVTGLTLICPGGTCDLNDASPGGTWSTSDATVSVNSSGIVTGLSAGTGSVTYTISSGCARTVTVTVNPAPSPITGIPVLCAGSTTALTDAGSGTWTTSNPSVASVGATGIVTGATAGTAAISYATGASCFTVDIITVNPAPSGIGGASAVCAGNMISLSDFTSGGSWSTTATNISLDVTGNVTGISAGSATITYSTSSSCYATKTINVNPLPGPILGNTTVCPGALTFLSDATTGSVVWSSGNTSVATINASGAVTAVSLGTATITYTIGTGCIATTVVTVTTFPSAISGSTPMCPGATVALTDASGTGTWSSYNTAIAAVNSGTGLVTGISSGTTIITYAAAGAGCIATAVVTVNTLTAIYGTMSMCQGASVTLHNTTSGGSWSTGSGSITIGSASGTVTGNITGTASVTYTLPTGCFTTAIVTVNPFAAPITGNVPVCVGSGITLGETTPGGTWSSGSGNATVDLYGDIVGIGYGTAVISYIIPTGCNVTTIVTINPIPGTINGNTIVCVAATTSLSDFPSGGTWSCTSAAASVGATGIVTGVAPGVAIVSYTSAGGCSTITQVTVNAIPSPVSGNTAMCIGASINVSVTTGGGMWVSSSSVTATVGSASGTVTALGAGVVTISYVLGTGCATSLAISINPVPAAITGILSVCSGVTTYLADATPGGTWMSDNTAIATVGSTGAVFGAGAAGTANITYGFSAVGCTVSKTVTVNPVPAAISGTAAPCIGATATLSDATTGGTWTSGTTLVATINGSTGVVTGVAAGTAKITYTAGGCIATTIATVNAVPGGIGGSSSVCNGSVVSLSDFTAGGTWSSSAGVSLSPGTVASNTMVTGTAVGTSTVTYSVSAGCYKTFSITVKALPTPILGTLTLCAGGGLTFLSDLTTSVSWTTSPVTVATVTASGRVYGVSAGTAVVTFTPTDLCYITAIVTVNPLPVVSAISGANNVSHGATTTLSDATPSGRWSSSNAAIASVGSGTGVVTGVAASGTATISYIVTDVLGCVGFATQPMTVHTPAPPAHGGSVNGSITLATGTAIRLDDGLTSGAWSSSDNTVALVDDEGNVSGLAPGFANISHTVTNGSEVSTSLTPVVVNAVPMEAQVIPNPNKGLFVVKGTTGSTIDEELTLEITDVLGQVIYTSKVTAREGKVNETISLGSTLANGMYMLKLHTGNGDKVFHLVIEK